MKGTRLLYRSPTFGFWGFIHPWHVEEQQRHRLGMKHAQRQGAQHRAQLLGREQGYPLQASAEFSLARDRLLGKDGQRWFRFGKKAGSGMRLRPLSHRVLLWKEAVGAEWQKVCHSFVFSVPFHYRLQSSWIYTSMFCISHFLDPWRSIAHSNTINISSK